MKSYIKTLEKNISRKKKIIDDDVDYFKGIPLFKWVEISPIDACNRKCSFCPKADPKIAPDTYKKMHIDLVKKLNKEFLEIGFKGTIVFAGYGEPLLNKNIFKMIKLFSKSFNTEVTTNGDPLNEKVINKLVDSGVNKIIVSLYDGPHQINDFKKLFQICNISEEKFVLRDRWYNADEGYGLMLTNRAGTLNFKQKNAPKKIDKRCFYSHYSMMIDWNGDIFLCTQDWNRKIKSGNVFEKHILDIWNSDLMENYRKELSLGKRITSPCINCNANGTMHGINHANSWEKYYNSIKKNSKIARI